MTNYMNTLLHTELCKMRNCPRETLSRDIVRVIEMRRTRACQIKLWGFTALGTLSLIAIVPAVTGLVQELGQSGFYQYASIGFSDPHIVSEYTKQFTVTLLEALPGMSVALVLAVLFVFGWSARNMSRQSRRLTLIHLHL